jgi:quinol monooxygenase YgiN
MAIMLKIRWDIKSGRENDFRENQKKLCAVMSSDHPGVICYHVDYPAPGVSEWVEVYANNDVFKAHLANKKGKEPLATLIGACEKITCKCWGDPDDESKKILAGFGATYHPTAEASFALNPKADPGSLI